MTQGISFQVLNIKVEDHDLIFHLILRARILMIEHEVMLRQSDHGKVV